MNTDRGVESHRVLQRVFKKKGNKFMAQKLKLSRSLVDKWARPGKAGRGEELNPLDRVELIIGVTEDLASLHWLCARFDGRFVPVAPVPPVAGAELPQFIEGLVPEVARLQVEIAVLLSRRSLSASEKEPLRRVWARVESQLDRLLAS
jgi:hypothetical protein